jgi:hypothetical protein
MIKKLILMFLFTTIACTPSIEKKEEFVDISEDSSNTNYTHYKIVYNNLLRTKFELDSVKEKLDTSKKEKSELVKSIIKKIKFTDSLLCIISKETNSQIDVIIATNKLIKAQSDNNKFFKQLDSSNKLNYNLNALLKHEYSNSKKKNKELSELKETIQQASKLTPVGINIKSYGINWLTNKPFETDKASKIKQVVISFILPQNKLFIPKHYIITGWLYGNGEPMSTTIELNYNGTEQEIDLSFIETVDYKIGDHNIELIINNEIIYKGILVLK